MAVIADSITPIAIAGKMRTEVIKHMNMVLMKSEDLFKKGLIESAYKMAVLAKEIDPDTGCSDRFIDTYRVLVAAKKRNSSGEQDHYMVLGIKNPAANATVVEEAYNRLVESIMPTDTLCCAAAEDAMAIVDRAWGVLGDCNKRREYDLRAVRAHTKVGSKRPHDACQMTNTRKIIRITSCKAY